MTLQSQPITAALTPLPMLLSTTTRKNRLHQLTPDGKLAYQWFSGEVSSLPPNIQSRLPPSPPKYILYISGDAEGSTLLLMFHNRAARLDAWIKLRNSPELTATWAALPNTIRSKSMNAYSWRNSQN